MLGRSVTFRPESIEKRSQRGTLKNLTTPNVAICRKILVFSDNYDEKGAHITPRQFRRQLDKKTSVLAPHMETL